MSPSRPQPSTVPLGPDPDVTADLDSLIAEVVPFPDQWKLEPNPVLGGEKPIDLIGTARQHVLRDMLRAAKQGMVS